MNGPETFGAMCCWPRSELNWMLKAFKAWRVVSAFITRETIRNHRTASHFTQKLFLSPQVSSDTVTVLRFFASFILSWTFFFTLILELFSQNRKILKISPHSSYPSRARPFPIGTSASHRASATTEQSRSFSSLDAGGKLAPRDSVLVLVPLVWMKAPSIVAVFAVSKCTLRRNLLRLLGSLVHLSQDMMGKPVAFQYTKRSFSFVIKLVWLHKHSESYINIAMGRSLFFPILTVLFDTFPSPLMFVVMKTVIVEGASREQLKKDETSIFSAVYGVAKQQCWPFALGVNDESGRKPRRDQQVQCNRMTYKYCALSCTVLKGKKSER